MRRLAPVFALCVFVAGGCGDDDNGAADAGAEASADMRPDPVDLGDDGGGEDVRPMRDLGSETGPDAEPDAGPDDAGDAGDGGCATRLCAGECCEAGEDCGPITGRCVAPCASGVLCGDDECCPEGSFCDPVLRACGSGCPPAASCNGMCCGEGELCDVASGGCVRACPGGVLPCADVCCAAPEVCDTTRDLCVPPCPTARVCGDACCDDIETCGPRTMLCVPSCGGAPPCGASDACCTARERCAFDMCVLDLGPCVDDADCDDDSWCDAGRCTPYGVGPRPSMAPMCTVSAPPGVVVPGVECAWAGGEPGDAFGAHSQVLTTPLVVDLDLDFDPTTRRPTIVVIGHGGTRDDASLCGGTPVTFAVLRGIDGSRCVSEFVIDEPVAATTSPAAADLDGDGRPELIAVDSGGRVIAFRLDPTSREWGVLWRSTTALGGASAPLAGRCHWAGIAVADMDDDAVPEVLLAGLVYRGDTGVQRGEVTALLTATPNGIGPVVADVDLDGRQELVAGTGVFELRDVGMVAESWSPAGMSEGWIGLADFGSFDALGGADIGYPEVVVVSNGAVRVQTIDGRIVFGPIVHPGVAPTFFGGPPAIADLDGDGAPEIAVAGGNAFAVFDLECTGPIPGRCEALGIRWTEPIDDTTSARTAAAVFDFEGDGRAEVAFSDECFVRIWDGATGEAILSLAHTSCTWSEGPAVADIDLDGHAELVVPENAICGVACPAVDPSFRGQHCALDADCGGGAGSCESGYCRCTRNSDCLGAERVCRPPIPGTPGRGGNVCRAQHPLRTFDGLRVIGDELDRWSPARPLWNEHAYSGTNVLDDGTVPRASAVTPSWSSAGGNVFRGQIATLGTPPVPDSAPDVTLRFGATITCAETPVRARANVCNRGTRTTGASVSVAFYEALPRSAATLRCTAATGRAVDPGECIEVSCDIGSAPLPAGELFGVADDDGTGRSAIIECIESNNEAHGVCERA